MHTKPELLAPAGSMESAIAALRCGADAIYIGTKQFSARQNAVNFDSSELDGVASLCRLYGAKLYIAVNTMLFDDELEAFSETVKRCAEIGADAFIVQDLGGASIIKKIVPQAVLHASTQMTVHTPQGAEFAKSLGFARIVAARELSENQLGELCKTGIEVEAFVHGALCMSVSGQCYLSSAIGGRSANRGLCAQPCRLCFSSESSQHALSLKDLSLLDHIGRLSEMGVASLKIEGRMKRPEYVAAAVCAYRSAIDGKKSDFETLKKAFSRGGFTDGYFTGNIGAEMFGVRSESDKTDSSEVWGNLRSLYRNERSVRAVDFTLRICPQKVILEAKTGESITVSIEKVLKSEAQRRPLDRESIVRQLSKLGGTVFYANNIDIIFEAEAGFPLSAINEIRRLAIAELEARITSAVPQRTICDTQIICGKTRKKNSQPKLWAGFDSAESLLSLNGETTERLERVILPLAQLEKCDRYPAKLCEKTIVEPPRFIEDEDTITARLKKIFARGFKNLCCTNVALISIGKKIGFSLHGGFGLNAANSETLRLLEKSGLESAVVSFEARAKQLERIDSSLYLGMLAYGRLPLMLTKNCPLGNCASCRGFLTDRTGRKSPVRCPKHNEGMAELLNGDILWLADKKREFDRADFFLLDFFDEDAKRIKEVINAYDNGAPADIPFTRGLYFRGLEKAKEGLK